MSTVPPADNLSPLQLEILDEYARLLANLQTMSQTLEALSDAPVSDVMEGLRGLERKMAPVFTLMKTSVYSMVLMQELEGEE